MVVVVVMVGARPRALYQEPCSPFNHNGHLGQQKGERKAPAPAREPTESSASRTFTCIDMQLPASWERERQTERGREREAKLWLQHVHEHSAAASNPENVSDTTHYSSLAELGKSTQVAHNYKLEQLLWESQMAGQTHKTHQRERRPSSSGNKTATRYKLKCISFVFYAFRVCFAFDSLLDAFDCCQKPRDDLSMRIRHGITSAFSHFFVELCSEQL